MKREVTKRGFNRYPSVLTKTSDLPAELRSPSLMQAIASKDIQTIVVFPPQIQRGRQYIPKQGLLFSSTEMIHLLASIWPDQEPQITRLKADSLMIVRVTLILLYGLLEIVAHGNASPIRLSMEFSSTSWNYLSRPLRQLLLRVVQVAPGSATEPGKYSLSVQKAFEKLPLKFYNGVRIYGLLPGEELEELVFQPGVWKRWMYLFKRPDYASTMLLLTSHYLVILQEDLDDTYGWILSYIPRNIIIRMKNQPCSQFNELTVELKLGDQVSDYKFRLQDEATQALREGWIKHGGQWKDLFSLSAP